MYASSSTRVLSASASTFNVFGKDTLITVRRLQANPRTVMRAPPSCGRQGRLVRERARGSLLLHQERGELILTSPRSFDASPHSHLDKTLYYCVTTNVFLLRSDVWTCHGDRLELATKKPQRATREAPSHTRILASWPIAVVQRQLPSNRPQSVRVLMRLVLPSQLLFI